MDVEVIDLRTLYPVDYATIFASVKKTGRVIVATEEPPHGGVGAEVAAAIGEHVFAYLEPCGQGTAKDSPIPHSPPLIDAIVPSHADIAAALRHSFTEWPSSG